MHLLHVGKFHERVLTFLSTPDNKVTATPEDQLQMDQASQKVVDASNSDNIIIFSVNPQADETVDTPASGDVQVQSEAIKESMEECNVSKEETAVTTDETSGKVEVEPVVKSEEVSVNCTLCEKNNKTRTFEKKSEFLKHLSLIHYGKQILTLYPWSLGDKCRFCLESASRKEYRANKKELHVCHVAIMHQKLFELIPQEISQLISSMPSTRRQEGRARPSSSQVPSLACKYCDSVVPRSEMREHLISHKTHISQRTRQEFNSNK